MVGACDEYGVLECGGKGARCGRGPTLPLNPQISLIRNPLPKRLQLIGPPDRPLQYHIHARMRILAPIADNLMPLPLLHGVPIGIPSLLLISNAAVEVLPAFGIASELRPRFVQKIIDEFRHRTVNTLHHFRELIAFAQIADCMVVVVQE